MKKIYFLVLVLFVMVLASCDDTLIINYEKIQYLDDYDISNDSLKQNGPNTTKCMGSSGDINVLILPISFNNNDEIIERISEIFVDSKDIYPKSVHDFFLESSYNKLNINFDIVDKLFVPTKKAEEYEKYYNKKAKMSGINKLLIDCLNYFDESIDYSKYDNDKDGYIDGIWIIHDKQHIANTIWCPATNYNKIDQKFDGVYPYSFSSANTILSYDLINKRIDSSIYIHETSHLMGADDYYSYKEQENTFINTDIMLNNKGDHCSLTKILLGWVKPIIINKDTTIDLESYSKTGNCILVANQKINTIYEEYFLIEYITPNGLFMDEYPYIYNNILESGIRIIHVDARVNTDKENNIISNGGNYSTSFLCDNTDTKNKFMKILLNNNRLFSTGDIFGINCYQNYKTHLEESIDFTIKINKIDENKANISINFK